MFAQKFPEDLNGIIFSRQRFRRAENRISLPAAVTLNNSDNWVTVDTFEIPKTDCGYVVNYSNSVIDPSWDYNGSITFRIQINGSAIDECSGFSEQRGTIPQPAPCLAFMKPGDTLFLQTRRAIAGTSARDIVMSASIITWNQQISSPWLAGKKQDGPLERIESMIRSFLTRR